MSQFAEEEIYLPDGPHQGRRFRCDRQPYVMHLYKEIDSGKWRRIVCTGPTQSGKTLCTYIIPLMYHLFEIGETVICGCIDRDMARDKWYQDILPAIKASRFAHLLPDRGIGRSGGFGVTIPLQNGAVLRFMTAGGGDKSRSAFTARVVVITEGDGMDESGGTSREADKVTQIIARTDAYGDRARIYEECTVSIEEGRTWREYNAGSKSTLYLRCPYCDDLVDIKREHLTGWQGVETEHDARDNGAFGCSSCGVLWSEPDRRKANLRGCVVHDGQHVEGGKVVGERKRTDTLGFRWTAAHNLFQAASHVAYREWRAAQSEDEENAEKEMRQFVWALPYIPPKADLSRLDYQLIARRMIEVPRGRLPQEALYLTAGLDLGKYIAWYVVMAWSEGATPHVVDYGSLAVPTDDHGEENALGITLREWSEMCRTGWSDKSPDVVLIDSGNWSEVVYQFVREYGRPYWAAKGQGEATTRKYTEQRKPGEAHPHVGDNYHVVRMDSSRVHLVQINADRWKTFTHDRLSTPVGKPGAMTLYDAPHQKHIRFGKHLTAEKKVEEFIAGKGTVIRWESLRRDNHLFDAAYMACCAGHMAGARLEGPSVIQPQQTPKRLVAGGVKRPDGRPYTYREKR